MDREFGLGFQPQKQMNENAPQRRALQYVNETCIPETGLIDSIYYSSSLSGISDTWFWDWQYGHSTRSFRNIVALQKHDSQSAKYLRVSFTCDIGFVRDVEIIRIAKGPVI